MQIRYGSGELWSLHAVYSRSDGGAGLSTWRDKVAVRDEDPEQAVESWVHTGVSRLFPCATLKTDEVDENDSVFGNIELCRP